MSLISIYIGGVLTLFMAVVHTRYYKFFRWKAEFRKVSELNQKVFYTIHLALLLLFFVIGTLTLVYAEFLSRSEGMALGFNLLVALLWLWRAVWQVFYFKSKELMHFLFMLHFFVTSLAYFIPVIIKLTN
ncbi:MAG: hypothetical protein KAS97_13530 [Candidatus Aminicenantes bacterium]|nr:hypothetical protein [Candidatus Aminicenantes bacterium]